MANPGPFAAAPFLLPVGIATAAAVVAATVLLVYLLKQFWDEFSELLGEVTKGASTAIAIGALAYAGLMVYQSMSEYRRRRGRNNNNKGLLTT